MTKWTSGRQEVAAVKVQLLLEVISDMRNLADGLEELAQAIADGGNQPKTPAPRAKLKEQTKPAVTHEMLRELAVEITKSGKRSEVKDLITSYGVKNITAIAEADLENFYADLLTIKEANSDATD